MKTQGERYDFLWRPNDNSATTLHKYDLEAKHWVNAVKRNSQPDLSFTQALSDFGIIIGFFLSIIRLLLMIIHSIFNWLFYTTKFNKPKPIDLRPRTASNGGTTVGDYMLDWEKLPQEEKDAIDMELFGCLRSEIPVVNIDDLEIPNRKELFEDALLNLKLKNER